MAKPFYKQAHFKRVTCKEVSLGRNPYVERQGWVIPRRVEAVLKNESSSTHIARCRSSRFKRDAVEPEAGHGCRRNNQAAVAVLARFSG